MANNTTAAFGILATPMQTETCVAALVEAGFRRDDISVLMPNTGSTNELVTEKSSKAPEIATTGAATGGVLGGTLGLLVGIGMLAVPGVGPFIAAGPVMLAAFAGFGAGAAAGGLIGGLIGLGIPEYEAKRYEGRVKNGGILISVHGEDGDWTKKAAEVLENNGAEDISSVSESIGDLPSRMAS